MSSDRWSQIEELYARALDRSPAERSSFLEANCEDPEVRREVRSLLRRKKAADEYFDQLSEAIPSVFSEGQSSGSDRDEVDGDPLELEGVRIDQYRVEAFLGGGGMGLVYRAADVELGRPVALKFLPAHLTSNEEAKKRFAREARAAAALDHPHIATIYEVGETEGGRAFIAMAYYEGETLGEKLSEGPLPAEEALRYARQLAKGLERAHQAGIVHRDLKPANVVVTEEGGAMLLDFGLARIVSEGELTETDQALGTAAYMSPEQIEGEPVGPPTDVWALGVLLHEMLTGERPFQGDRRSALIHAILHREPVGLEKYGDVDEELASIVRRCLRKHPEERYATAGDLLEALTAVSDPKGRAPPMGGASGIFEGGTGTRRVLIGLGILAVLLAGIFGWMADAGSGPGAAGDDDGEAGTTVAVFPFDVSGPGSTTWRKGMVTVLSTNLDGAAGIRAVAESHVLAAWESVDTAGVAGQGDPASRAARSIGADYAISGAAVAMGSELRLSAEVYTADSERPLGRTRVRGSPDSVMALADELTRQVLAILLEESREAIPSVDIGALTTRSLPALKRFLSGEIHFRDGEYRAALEDYQSAVVRDSTFALAHARLARSHGWLSEYEQARRTWRRAYRYSGRLPERDRRLVRAQYLWVVEDRMRAAADRLRQLTKRYPDDPSIWLEYGEVLYHRWIPMPGAYAEVRFEGWMPISWEKVEGAFKEAAALDPGVASYHYHLVDMATSLRHDSTLAAERLEAMPEGGWKPYFRQSLDLVFGSAGVRDRALAALDSAGAPPLTMLLHPSDTRLWSRVARRLPPGRTVAKGYYLTVQLPPPLRRGRVKAAARWMDQIDPDARNAIGLNRANEACFLALAMTVGASLPDSIVRPLLEPDRLESDAPFRRLRCAGYYLAERGRNRELDSLVHRLETRVAEGLDEPGEQYSSPEKALDELRGYRAFRSGDLERAAELWQGFNTAREWGAIWRGDLYRRLDQPGRAERWYKAAWSHPLAHQRLGKLYEKQNRIEEAVAAYHRFTEGWADAGDPHQSLVRSARKRIRVLTGSLAAQ